LDAIKAIYAESMDVTVHEQKWLIQNVPFYELPADCNKESCPYVCNTFMTPTGIDAEEILYTAGMELNEEELKVLFTKRPELLKFSSENNNAIELLGHDNKRVLNDGFLAFIPEIKRILVAYNPNAHMTFTDAANTVNPDEFETGMNSDINVNDDLLSIFNEKEIKEIEKEYYDELTREGNDKVIDDSGDEQIEVDPENWDESTDSTNSEGEKPNVSMD